MPTKNRSSNTEMVSVPRKLAKSAARWLEIYFKEPSAERSVADELRKALAQPAEQHNGKPVGEVVAFGKGLHEIAWAAGRMPKLGTKLYTHADPGEVERLRAEIKSLRQHKTDYMDAAEETRKALLAQLAERDALLREWRHGHHHTLKSCASILQRTDAALSASAESSAREAEALAAEKALGIERLPAEPSAPVERDERAASL